MTDSDELLQERVMRTVERIEDADSPEDLGDPLEVKAEASLDGTLTEVIRVESTGGPHIEIRLFDGVVKGWWESSRHTAPVFENEEMLESMGERHARYWENSIVR